MTNEEIDCVQKARENGVALLTYFMRLVNGWKPEDACKKTTKARLMREKLEKVLKDENT